MEYFSIVGCDEPIRFYTFDSLFNPRNLCSTHASLSTFQLDESEV